MVMFKKILIPLDGSTEAEAALPYIQGLAPKFGSEVDLISVGLGSKRRRVNRLLEEYVNDMDCSDLPDNITELLNIPEEISKLSGNNSHFKERLSGKLSELLLENNTLKRVVDNLHEDSAVIDFLKNQTTVLLRDAAFRTALSERIKLFFLNDKKGGEALVSALSTAMATTLADKLLEPRRF